MTQRRPKPSALINDGHTLDGYVAEFPGLYPAVRFTYRPMLIEQRSELLQKTGAVKSSAQSDRIIAKALSEHLASWDICKDDGTAIPVDARMILRLQFKLYDRLTSIVLFGLQAADPDPLHAGDEPNEEDDTIGLSALSGANLIDTRAEVSEKN